MNWSSARVFVTGVDGFVGANLARVLIRKGAKVSGLVHQPPKPGSSGLLAWGIAGAVCTYVGDVADTQRVVTVLAEARPEWIFHLAAQATVAKAQDHAFETLESNVEGTWNVVYLAAQLPALRGLVVASSDKAYGTSPTLPYTEETPLAGGSIYDCSKASADVLARALARRFDLPLAVTRCANIYGPGDLNFTRIVPDAVAALCRGERLRIRGNGLHERDFLFIDDAVTAYLTLASRIREPGVRAEAFNFGSGEAVRIVDLVHTLLAVAGTHLEPEILGRDLPHEISRQRVDASKARRLLGWAPTVPLSEGLRRTIDWYRSFLDAKLDEQR
jgi:CDP-glucose 4,6-dehydratase